MCRPCPGSQQRSKFHAHTTPTLKGRCPPSGCGGHFLPRETVGSGRAVCGGADEQHPGPSPNRDVLPCACASAVEGSRGQHAAGAAGTGQSSREDRGRGPRRRATCRYGSTWRNRGQEARSARAGAVHSGEPSCWPEFPSFPSAHPPEGSLAWPPGHRGGRRTRATRADPAPGTGTTRHARDACLHEVSSPVTHGRPRVP